jgi:hypothetical protein
MIDFPTLFPSLVKYIPNWMEKFYPRIAQFARGEGYPCGNKGVFIPRRNKCWTHPKTGNRLKQPLTYQKYQEAKEKSQRSKTEKGRTALANREQSFRDKAREKVKGWQKNKPASQPQDKSVDQQYKDIIASSKNPKGTEDAVSSALKNGVSDFDRENYNRYLSAIKSGKADKGVVGYYQDQIDRYKPVIDAENFINERRQKAIAGDYETEQEAGVYVLNKLKQKGYKEHEYYDSPDYEKDYGKLVGVMKSTKLPPPLSGTVPSRELKQTLTQGDKLLIKKDTYSLMGGGNTPTGYQIVDGGEVLKVNVKNVKTRVKGEYMGKPYENESSIALDNVSHVIRDGKRYKVDLSDSSPNGLGIQKKVTTETPQSRKKTNIRGANGRSEPDPIPYTDPLGYRNDPLDKFDKSLDKEVEKLQQKTRTIPIETLKGKVDNSVSDYGNGLAVWKNKDNKKKEEVYTVVHTPSGKRLTAYDSIEEDQSKRIVAGLTAIGVDWTKEEKEFTKDERLKDLNGLMRRVLDSNYRRFEIADKKRLDKLRKARDEQDKKNDFNSNLKLAQFAKPGCCCDASKPLRRRKTKQTPRLKRRGTRYA